MELSTRGRPTIPLWSPLWLRYRRRFKKDEEGDKQEESGNNGDAHKYLKDSTIEAVQAFSVNGLLGTEDFDLTLDGLIAKALEWNKEYDGVVSYIYDDLKEIIEEAGGTMPEEVKRMN